MAFSKFKAFLKRRAARTVTQLDKAIAKAIDTYAPNECKKLLRCCWIRPYVIG